MFSGIKLHILVHLDLKFASKNLLVARVYNLYTVRYLIESGICTEYGSTTGPPKKLRLLDFPGEHFEIIAAVSYLNLLNGMLPGPQLLDGVLVEGHHLALPRQHHGGAVAHLHLDQSFKINNASCQMLCLRLC